MSEINNENDERELTLRRRWTHGAVLGSLILAVLAIVAVYFLTRPSVANVGTWTSAIPIQHYGGVAWIRDDLVALLPVEEVGGRNRYVRVELYDLVTGERWDPMLQIEEADCLPISFIVAIDRVSDSEVALHFRCFLVGSGVATGKLLLWNIDDNSLETLLRYPQRFTPGAFALAPSRQEFIIERAVGNLLSNELHYFASGRLEGERILPDFQRAMSPVWSSNGEKIYFVGTMARDGGNLTGIDDIVTLALAPWSIYELASTSLDQPRKLVDIPYATHLGLSCDSRKLAFYGKYRGVDGVWVLDIATGDTTRVWERGVAFSWSPDGKRLVIKEFESDASILFGNNYLVVVELND